MTEAEDRALEAGRLVFAYEQTDQPASGLIPFVTKYLFYLQPSAAGDDLKVVNRTGEAMFVRRDPIYGHRGWITLISSQKFRTSSMQQLLDVGQGKRRTMKTLVDELVRFNNQAE